MRSNGLATIMLMVPVLTVPALAIFGIPQFAPVVASPLDDESSNNRDTRNGKPERRSHDDLFDDVEGFGSEPDSGNDSSSFIRAKDSPRRHQRPRDTSRSSQNQPSEIKSTASSSDDFAQDREISQAGFTDDSDNREILPAKGSKPRARPKELPKAKKNERSADTLTWKSAVDRLDEFEIRNFRLVPGNQQGQFVFICSYTPPDSPTVSYRFEAGAEEPLKAVEKVIEQIVEWRQGR